jgi:hypothetical protein
MTNGTSGSTSGDGLTLFTNSTDAGLMQRENSYLLFGTNDTERMRIDSSGNVGIGTTSPAVLNHISAGYSAPTNGIDSNIFSLISNSASTGSYAGLGILAGTAAASFIHFGDTDDMNVGALDYFHSDNSMRFSTNATERMRINSSGNLLVGTTSSQGLITATTTGSTTFDCARTETSTANNIILRNGNGAVGSIQTSGSSTSYNTSSDQRLKENITDSDEARSKVNAIQVRKFNWKVDGSYQPYGMIAQELQSIVPEAVSSPEKPEEMFGVDYSKLVPLLTKAIQEQQTQIEALQSEINTLKGGD